MLVRSITLTILLVMLSAFSTVGAKVDSKKNILLIIADDMGAEKLGCYGLAENTPVTPIFDQLCDEGVKYTRVWSQPTCTPTRISMMTGRYGFRTGSLSPTGPRPNFKHYEDTPKFLNTNQVVMSLIKSGQYVPKPNAPIQYMMTGEKPPYTFKFGKGLGFDETTLPQILKKQANYETAAIGKWHMTNLKKERLNHPHEAGFDFFMGTMACCVDNYYRYKKVSQGEEIGYNKAYATTESVNDAIEWIENRKEDNPWFMWLALHAPHDPFQKPPDELISAESQKLDPDGIDAENVHLYFDAMIEAMDAEIGRLLERIDDDTIVIFVGDNGTPQGVVRAPYRPDQGKGELFQGGVHVPLIISGSDISVRKDNRLAHTVDLFATILEFADVNLSGVSLKRHIDSKSLISHSRRNWVFADQKGILPTGVLDEQTVRNKRYKLIVDHHREKLEFFDLKKDPFESAPLDLENLNRKQRRNFKKLRRNLENYAK